MRSARRRAALPRVPGRGLRRADPGVTRNREEYLEYIAGPRPFTDLALLESRVRVLADVALIHGRTSYKLVSDGSRREALYTDAYQKRDGEWLCISVCAIAPGA